MDDILKSIDDLNSFGSLLGLSRIKAVMKHLGNIQDELNVVHVAGTNGKGSTIAFLEQIAICDKIKVGAYTSPALSHFSENIRVNGVRITTEEIIILSKKIFKILDNYELILTRFEFETVLAFLYFYKEKCDVVFLEVGLGGEDDATNIIKNPILTVFTSFGLDHFDEFGHTIYEIVTSECEIIKKGADVVTVRQNDEILEIIKKAANKKKSEFIVAELNTNLDLSTGAKYQIKNASLAVKVAEILGFNKRAVLQGLKTAKWQGRFEIIKKDNCTFVLDGAHNESAVKALKSSLLHKFGKKKFIFIVGIYFDKDIKSMLQCIGDIASVIITTQNIQNKRLLTGGELTKVAEQYHNNIVKTNSISEAVKKAKELSDDNSVVVICGSLSLLGEASEIILGVNKNKNEKS